LPLAQVSAGQRGVCEASIVVAAAKKSDSKLSHFVGEVRSLKKRTVVYGSHREAYLKGLFDTVYGADIVERFAIENPFALDQLVKELASAVGSLTNPSKLANTLNTVAHAGATDKTVKRYLDALTDAFIFSEVERFDVKGKRYFDYPMKYYATDAGIRNALLNFRQIEETHLMENVIYNELVLRSYAVGVIPFLLRPEILE
jgi:predicted AAA+ superfamily ATPase